MHWLAAGFFWGCGDAFRYETGDPESYYNSASVKRSGYKFVRVDFGNAWIIADREVLRLIGHRRGSLFLLPSAFSERSHHLVCEGLQ